ncbi:hypothetical protein MPH_04348, partial [Macrophomina phaseolina MS6]
NSNPLAQTSFHSRRISLRRRHQNLCPPSFPPRLNTSPRNAHGQVHGRVATTLPACPPPHPADKSLSLLHLRGRHVLSRLSLRLVLRRSRHRLLGNHRQQQQFQPWLVVALGNKSWRRRRCPQRADPAQHGGVEEPRRSVAARAHGGGAGSRRCGGAFQGEEGGKEAVE